MEQSNVENVMVKPDAMLKKLSDQIYNLRAGEYFDVIFSGRYFRINAVLMLMMNRVRYNTIVIAFGDDTPIVSTPDDSTKDIVNKFLKKVKSLTLFTEEHISYISDIEKY